MGDGVYTLVDAKHLQALSHHAWRLAPCGYVRAYVAGRCVYLHRAVAQAEDMLDLSTGRWRAAEEVDHRDGDLLDNREANLRTASRQQNMQNTRGVRSSASRYKGVSPGNGRMRGKWRAQIKTNGKQHHLGYFGSEEEAARAYDRAALAAFGEFAFVNFQE